FIGGGIFSMGVNGKICQRRIDQKNPADKNKIYKNGIFCLHSPLTRPTNKFQVSDSYFLSSRILVIFSIYSFGTLLTFMYHEMTPLPYRQ
ncbi:MAG: hypothetical protein ORN57_00620, partial [Alphaproteobacteria bacterium]|nr:hypothetical protein [Alphaproteobacteria bacterium]